MRARLIYPYIIARQLIVEEMIDIELWCGGQIKGTKLPPQERAIDLRGVDGEEARAGMGDWIIRIGCVDGKFRYLVLGDDMFRRLFEEHK